MVRRFLVAVLALGFSATFVRADEPKVENAREIAAIIAAGLIARQTGEAVKPEEITAFPATLDDRPGNEIAAFRPKRDCADPSCGIFLFALRGADFVDLFKDIGAFRHIDPAAFAYSPFVRNGIRELMFGEAKLAWDGKTFVPASSIPGSKLRTDAYVAACNKSAGNDNEIEAARLDRDKTQGAYCSCMANRYQEVALDQPMLDAITGWFGTPELPEGPTTDAFFDRLSTLYEEELGCQVLGGWASRADNSITPTAPGAVVQRLHFAPFMGACTGWATLLDTKNVGSADRLLSACGCVANEASANSWTQGQLDAVAAFYAGNISETDLDAQSPGSLDASDRALGQCARELPE